MRLRKIAGLTVGALTLGMLGMPNIASAAPGDPTEFSQTADLQCTYTSYGSNYTGTITTSVADGSLKTVADDVQPFGMPAFLSIEKLTSKYTATVNGQPVTMTGEKVYSPGRAGNLSLPIPDATAPSAVSSVDSVVVSKLELGMAVRAFGSLSQASMICVPAVHTTVALAVTAGADTASLTATVTPSTATGKSISMRVRPRSVPLRRWPWHRFGELDWRVGWFAFIHR